MTDERKGPFFSIITVVRDDAWSLLTTARSVFEQKFQDFEYIVVDGASRDGTKSLVDFWVDYGLVTRTLSEPDQGVYNAMNKGLRMATGEFVCFLNANDVFASSTVLQEVHALLTSDNFDGALGWGKLQGQIWASWTEHEALKMASLGFCHQSLYVRRELILDTVFDERRFKTDSDTFQIGELYAKGARIEIVPEVWAVRGGDLGLSADKERTAISIEDTLKSEYPELDEYDATNILNFRRTCSNPEELAKLLDRVASRTLHHLARMILDTFFQKQSLSIEEGAWKSLISRSLDIVLAEDNGEQEIRRLISAQKKRAELLERDKEAKRNLESTIEKANMGRARKRRGDDTTSIRSDVDGLQNVEFAVSLTSFPARFEGLASVVRSLFDQSLPPTEVHLWLGRDEVRNKSWVPKSLKMLEAHGLRIHFAERTLRQYNKFMHNPTLNRNRAFIIVDDDVIYPYRALERLVETHRSWPDAVVGNRCHRITFKSNDEVAPYKEWEHEVSLPWPSHQLMATGVGGVLYPPGFLCAPIVTRTEDILSCAPYADDVWLKACALALNVPIVATALSHNTDWYDGYTPTQTTGSLMRSNVERGLNDVQIRRSLEWVAGIRPGWRDQVLNEESTA